MTLPEPHFIDRDPHLILADAVAWMEAELGRRLEPAQVETLMTRLIAYRETLVRIGIQEAAKQSLLAFARYPMIDFLGELLGAPRLLATSATCMLRFTVATAFTVRSILAGTRVRSADGRVTFATRSLAVIAPGATTVDVAALCLTTGEIGNDLAPGQVSTLASDLPFSVLSVANLDVTSGGAPDEETDAYRLRIPTAVDAASAAGPGAAYRALALRAHVDVLDASATRIEAGHVQVAVLGRTGVPSAGVVAAVHDYLHHEDRHQLLATVSVVAAAPVDYTISATLELDTQAGAAALAAAELAAAQYVATIGARLGASPVTSRASALLHVPGVRRVTLPSIDVSVTAAQFARCTSISVVPA